MAFMPPASRSRLVPGFGRKDAKIVVVGDFTSRFDSVDLRPFCGPNGTVLESCLHSAGLIKADVYMTNTIKTQTKYPPKFANTEFFDEKKGFTDLGMEHVAMLHEELNSRDFNVIVAAGNASLRALTDFNSVAKYRGYVCTTTKLKRTCKLIPTHSPASAIRGAYTNRHLIVCDLRKAKLEADFPEIVRPARQLVYDYSSVEEALQWLDWLAQQPMICFDIEVINYEMACISFSASPDIAVVIPVGHTEFRPQGWEELEELQLWRGIQKVLGNPESVKIVQNGIFDIHFLLTRCGIVVRGPIRDTMIAHSVMFPELPKGLAFLGSIYNGSQAYWKDSVKFDNIKDES